MAAIYHMLMHACAKSALFISSSGLADASGNSKRFSDLRGCLLYTSEQSMDQAAPQEAGGEVYASAEKRADDHRTALVEEERSYYSRVHEWSLHKGVKFINRLYRLSAVLVLCFIIFFLMSTVVALPPFGEADNPYNNEVSQRYIEKGIEETGAINFVAGMILDYRDVYKRQGVGRPVCLAVAHGRMSVPAAEKRLQAFRRKRRFPRAGQLPQRFQPGIHCRLGAQGLRHGHPHHVRDSPRRQLLDVYKRQEGECHQA